LKLLRPSEYPAHRGVSLLSKDLVFACQRNQLTPSSFYTHKFTAPFSPPQGFKFAESDWIEVAGSKGFRRQASASRDQSAEEGRRLGRRAGAVPVASFLFDPEPATPNTVSRAADCTFNGARSSAEIEGDVNEVLDAVAVIHQDDVPAEEKIAESIRRRRQLFHQAGG
jgi:hypothetical protein